MQIKALHRNIYRLYRYSRTQECLDVYRKRCVGPTYFCIYIGSMLASEGFMA
jgi:hypothetical protein